MWQKCKFSVYQDTVYQDTATFFWCHLVYENHIGVGYINHFTYCLTRWIKLIFWATKKIFLGSSEWLFFFWRKNLDCACIWCILWLISHSAYIDDPYILYTTPEKTKTKSNGRWTGMCSAKNNFYGTSILRWKRESKEEWEYQGQEKTKKTVEKENRGGKRKVKN